MYASLSRPQPTGLHAGRYRSAVHGPAECFALVAPEMAACERHLLAAVGSVVPAVTEISAYLAASGGKRLRPLLTALGARAAGHTGELAPLMCVGELVHLGSLLHDDVVDDGELRRGRPTAQRVYGNPAVILAGDYCVARGMALAAEHGGLTAVTELARTVASMSEGEVQQLLNAGDLALPVPAYVEVIEAKSATLIAWCLAVGAWAAGRDDLADALRSFGVHVGAAFQVADDVLDYGGELRLTGKARGRDLAQRKPTLPLLLAMERVPGLRERLEAGPPAEDELPELMGQVQGCGAPADALDYARSRLAEGLQDLDVLPPGVARDALASLAWHLAERVA